MWRAVSERVWDAAVRVTICAAATVKSVCGLKNGCVQTECPFKSLIRRLSVCISSAVIGRARGKRPMKRDFHPTLFIKLIFDRKGQMFVFTLKNIYFSEFIFLFLKKLQVWKSKLSLCLENIKTKNNKFKNWRKLCKKKRKNVYFHPLKRKVTGFYFLVKNWCQDVLKKNAGLGSYCRSRKFWKLSFQVFREKCRSMYLKYGGFYSE